MHFNLHEERCRAHFSKYCKTYFPTTQINGFTYIMSEEAVLRFPSYNCSQHFRKYRRKSSYVSNDCLWKTLPLAGFSAFTHSVKQLVCEIRPLIGNFGKTFHHRYLKGS